MSERIEPSHRSRKALVYIRQSSMHQVHNYKESRRLQYAMKDRMQELGWNEIEIIDDDLGQSASGLNTRGGFERMVAEVCMGHIGAVAAREVSRFARNNREWQQLIEVCQWVDTLLVDQDSVYHPRHGNDRLLLGLKGSLSEYELDIMRLRSLEARRAKASRGELFISAPVGYEKLDGCLVKTPNVRVQKAVALVFEKFLELGTARQALSWFLENDILFPSRRQGSTDGTDIIWKRPRYESMMRLLKHPVYAGIYVYGRTQSHQVFEDGHARKTMRQVGRDEWHVFLPEQHEGYIDRATWERIQTMIADNLQSLGNQSTKGAAKRGPALLSGLLRCRQCGRKLTVSYTGRERMALRYACHRGHLDIGAKKCISFSGKPLDDAIAAEIHRVLEPAALEASQAAWTQLNEEHTRRISAVQLELTEAQYAVKRSFRQYDAADPENRLVASELETRWNDALEHQSAVEKKLETVRKEGRERPRISMEDMEQLAAQLDKTWDSPHTDVSIKKRIVRTLIEEIIVDSSAEEGWLDAVIHWKGGIHTHRRIKRRKRGDHPHHATPKVRDAVIALARILPDETIAGVLNRNGIKTGKGNRWTRSHVCSFRGKRRIPAYNKTVREEEGWLTLTQAADELGISTLPLRKAIERGEIPALHPLPDCPWIINRSDIQTDHAKRIALQIKQRRKRGALQSPDQLSLINSGTCLEGAV